MNELILKFAKQAKLKGRSEEALSPVELEFAELIINECINQCLKNSDLERLSPGCTISALEIERAFGIRRINNAVLPNDFEPVNETWIEP